MFSLRMHKSPTPNEGLIFVSEDGMPLLVKLLFKEVDGQTEIDVSIDHTAPDLMIHWVGRFDFEDHVRRILRENLNVCLALPLAIYFISSRLAFDFWVAVLRECVTATM